MQMRSRNFPIGTLVEERDQYIIPDWQRREVWNTARKRLLVDSILRGWNLPKFYFSHPEGKADNIEIVDGQQRRSGIIGFIDNEFSLSPATITRFNLSGGMFRDLPPPLANTIRNFSIQSDEIFGATEGELNEFFLRLQGGTQLTSSEKLNAAHSGLRDFCSSVANHNFFHSCVALPDNRHAFFDMATKTVAVAIEGLAANLRYKYVEELFDSYRNFSPTSSVAIHTIETLNFLAKAFPLKAPELRNRSFVQSIITLASQIVVTGRSEGREVEFRNFVSRFTAHITRGRGSAPTDMDSDYAEFRRMMKANVVTGTRVRHDILVRKLHVLSPGLARLLGPDDGTNSWVPGAQTEIRAGESKPKPLFADQIHGAGLVTRSLSLTIAELCQMKNRLFYPDWQRGEVWDGDKKRLLIDSILRGWKLPKFYLARSADGSENLAVVDGQQRLKASLSFMGNGLALSPATVTLFGLPGRLFGSLPPKVADSIRNFTVEIDEISNANEEELREFFLRLQNGVPLTGREKLNAVHSGLRNFCTTLAKHPFFQTRVTFGDTRFAFFDVAIKAATVEIVGLDTRFKYENVKDLLEDNKDFSANSPIAERLNATLDFLARAFPSKSETLRNRSIVQAVVTLAARLVAIGQSEGNEEKFASFVEQFDAEFKRQKGIDKWEARDPGYVEFISTVSSADLAGRVRKRHLILIEKMQTIQPDLALLFVSNELAGLPPPETKKKEQRPVASARTTAKQGAPTAAAPKVPLVALNDLVTNLSDHMATPTEEFGNTEVKRNVVRLDLHAIQGRAAKFPAEVEGRHVTLLSNYLRKNIHTVGFELVSTFWPLLQILARRSPDGDLPLYAHVDRTVKIILGIGEDGQPVEAAGVGRNPAVRDFVRERLNSKTGRLLNVHASKPPEQPKAPTGPKNGDARREAGNANLRDKFFDAAGAVSATRAEPAKATLGKIPHTSHDLNNLCDEITALHQRRFGMERGHSSKRSIDTAVPSEQMLPLIRAKLQQIHETCRFAASQRQPEIIERAAIARLAHLNYPTGGSRMIKFTIGQYAKEVLEAVQIMLRTNPGIAADRGWGNVVALRAHGISKIVDDPEFMSPFLEECSEMASGRPTRVVTSKQNGRPENPNPANRIR